MHRQVLTPLDLERRFGITGGNIFHGEMSLDQMFVMRPVAGWARYRTPVRGLYLCGSGAHPGGGVMGAPGLQRRQGHVKRISRRTPKSATASQGAMGGIVLPAISRPRRTTYFFPTPSKRSTPASSPPA